MMEYPRFERPPDDSSQGGDNGGGTAIFDHLESNVRTYCRAFPSVFARAKGAILYDEAGRGYIDFFAGAGALNYGHNPDFIKPLLIDYLSQDYVVHALDMFTVAKRNFLETFESAILEPRRLDYKVQFCGPTGANAVEAAVKLARLVTGRPQMAAFTGGWHGMSGVCLSLTGNRAHRSGAGMPLNNTSFLPFPEGPYTIPDTLGYIRNLLTDSNSGFDTPAAFILETIQAEGGIYPASSEFLRGLRQICDDFGILMIADDIQVGCGRTADFFSFEAAGVVPDIVCLSKSIGGYGLPMALVLMKRSLDKWSPGMHTGTFRGNQLAFVAGAAALKLWQSPEFSADLKRRAGLLEGALKDIAASKPGVSLRGRGFIWGLDFTGAGGPEVAARATRYAFDHGLIAERCGRDDVVIKILPPITIEEKPLLDGCAILAEGVKRA